MKPQTQILYEARQIPESQCRIVEVRVFTNAACLHLADRDVAVELVQRALDRIEDENCPRGAVG